MQQDQEGECVLEIPHSIHDSVMEVVPLIRKLRTLVEETQDARYDDLVQEVHRQGCM